MNRSAAGLVLLLLAAAPAVAGRHVVVVEGLGGEARYNEAFADQVGKIEAASGSVVDAEGLHVLRGPDANLAAIEALFAGLADAASPADELVVYLVGHGTFDDHQYKFNLPGPDLTGDAFAALLEAHPAATQLVVATGSSSGALEDLLAGEGRTSVLATRSGRERHATTFGTWFAMALGDEAADLDKNRAITAGEAFRFAERQVADYYEGNNQLATEHPTLAGEFADELTLARFPGSGAGSTDSRLAALLQERQRINGEIEALRLARGNMPADEYQAKLLDTMLELARLEERIEARQGEVAQ